MPTSLEVFMKRLEESGLMTADEITTFHESLSPDARPNDAQGFARELVRQNNLTKLQAAAVYQGKIKNLIFGDYVVMDKIGAGGMGQVFSVRHQRNGNIYALKVLSADAVKNPKVVKRFHREAAICSKLNHPNIVRTIETGKMQQVSFLVMEFVDGETVRAHIKQNGPLAIDEAVRYLYQAALGLGYAHNQGIIHRDVSPNNLLLERNKRIVKLLDMGLARLEEDEDDTEAGRLTNPGQMLGTVDFMSPEHVNDARFVDARSDIYSLGCTFYYFLAGRSPYKGETPAHTLLAHVREPVPSLRKKRPDAPARLDEIFQKMLAKNPNERYQSMREMIIDLVGAGLVDGEIPPEPEPRAAAVPSKSQEAPAATISPATAVPQAPATAAVAEVPLETATAAAALVARQGRVKDVEPLPNEPLPNEPFPRHRQANAKATLLIYGGIVAAAVAALAYMLFF